MLAHWAKPSSGVAEDLPGAWIASEVLNGMGAAFVFEA
jgi:hypothetical protein